MSDKELRISDFAKIDLEREARTGIPEVVIAEGKKQDHLSEIVRTVLKKKNIIIVTRLDPAIADSLSSSMDDTIKVEYNADARVAIFTRPDFETEKRDGKIGVIAAGTSDFPVGEEARVVAEALGYEVMVEYDVGIAGVHRLFSALEKMINADVDVYIVIAGREGALPTLVSGVVDAPVIGVPVSSGYGYGGRGEAALRAMLQSCSPIAVVNIDAGFVAAVVAAQIARKIAKASKKQDG